MKLSRVVLGLGLCASSSASAGGLFLPGSGAVSTTRAGAAVASADDGEAIGLNPAGIAKGKGTRITIGFSAINYNMSFQRNGTYDTHDLDSESYEGQPYPLVENDAKPPLGIGRYQPIPVIAIVSDLGGAVPGLSAGLGLYAPNSYPFRRMNNVGGNPYFVETSTGYDFPAFGDPPPSTRYDIIAQEAAVILPSLAVAYRVLPDLDVGGRLSVGQAEVKSTVAVWGSAANYAEWIKGDGIFTLDAKDSFVLGWGLGAAYRPAPTIEIGANFSAPVQIRAEGDARAVNGPGVSLNGEPIMVQPSTDVRCAPGGTDLVQKGCAQIALPMTATLGGRYKIPGEGDKVKGDIELNFTWEHWGKRCDFIITPDPECYSPTDYRVVVDAMVTTPTTTGSGISLKDNVISHGLKDTFGVRLGGSYNIPVGANEVIARGGIAYDTAAAKKGWERADIDGAARTMVALGGSFKLPRVRIDAGFGYVYEGTRTDSRNCNPAIQPPPYQGCSSSMTVQPLEERQGPDPINPIVPPAQQLENPVNQGTFKSSYVLFMLGASTWF